MSVDYEWRVVSPEEAARIEAQPQYFMADCAFCDRNFGGYSEKRVAAAANLHVRAKHAEEVAAEKRWPS